MTAITPLTLDREYCGTNSPGIVMATNEDGALTFQFHSDQSVTESGWSANVGCDGALLPPIADFTAKVRPKSWKGDQLCFQIFHNEPTGMEMDI
ncbi:MAG: hypothetical protein R2764_07780 [Bacteroidales bacterium]